MSVSTLENTEKKESGISMPDEVSIEVPIERINQIIDDQNVQNIEDSTIQRIIPQVASQVDSRVFPQVVPQVDSQVAPQVVPQVDSQVAPQVDSQVAPQVVPQTIKIVYLIPTIMKNIENAFKYDKITKRFSLKYRCIRCNNIMFRVDIEQDGNTLLVFSFTLQDQVICKYLPQDASINVLLKLNADKKDLGGWQFTAKDLNNKCASLVREILPPLYAAIKEFEFGNFDNKKATKCKNMKKQAEISEHGMLAVAVSHKQPAMVPQMQYMMVSQMQYMMVPQMQYMMVPQVQYMMVPQVQTAMVPQVQTVMVPQMQPMMVPQMQTAMVPQMQTAMVPQMQSMMVPQMQTAMVPQTQPVMICKS